MKLRIAKKFRDKWMLLWRSTEMSMDECVAHYNDTKYEKDVDKRLRRYWSRKPGKKEQTWPTSINS